MSTVTVNLEVSVVLPAAGTGSRMGLPIPKQYCCVLGKPVISHTIGTFERIPWVKYIVVVASPDQQQFMTDICKGQGHKKVKVTAGASVRHRSIFNGVKYIQQVQPTCDVVVVHDGVRPFVGEDLLKDIVLQAHKHGAAGVVRPLVSTVVATDSDGFLEESLDRVRYRASEMPQAFQYRVILDAYKQCTDYDFDYGTECLHLAHKYGGAKCKLLDGPDYLWKVTHKKDLYALESILKAQVCVGVVGLDKDAPLLSSIQQRFTSKHRTLVVHDGKSSSELNHLIHYVRLNDPADLSKVDLLPADCEQLTCAVCVVDLTQAAGTDSAQMEHVARLRGSLQKLRSDSISVCAVVLHTEQLEKAADLIFSLVNEQSRCLSGQVLVV